MNVFVSGLKSILAKPSRFLLTILGVIVSTILLASTSVITASYVSSLYEKYDYFTEDKAYYLGSFSFDHYENLASQPKVKTSSFVSSFLTDYTSNLGDRLIPYTVQGYATEGTLFTLGLPAPYYMDFNIFDIQIERGRVWTKLEETTGKPVIVIDQISAKRLFKDADPIGKQLIIHDIEFSIIGVAKTVTGMYADESENSFLNLVMYLPYQTAKAYFPYGTETIYSMIIKSDVKQSIEEWESIFYEAIKIPADTVICRENVVEYLEMSFSLLFSLVNVFTVLALIISGFGLLNTMFFTINERISEIGIRKAVGANNANIVMQFFFESVLYILLGAVFGLFASFTLSLIFLNVMEIKIVINWGQLGGVILTILGIGIVFSIIPALKAGRMNVIDSLKFE